MFTFLRNVKKAADFFSIHPEGLRFVTERRLKGLEASVSKLPKAIEDRNLTRIINLEHESYKNFCELEQIVERIVTILEKTLDKKEASTQSLPVEQAKTTKKPKVVKLKAVEEKVKKVKPQLTQAQVKKLFEYRDGELYLKVNKRAVKKGIKVSFLAKNGSSVKRYVFINSTKYNAGRIIYLMFHGYLPEVAAYKDGNSLNTKIENIIAASCSEQSGYKGVTYATKTKKWVAKIMREGTNLYLGSFNSPEEAHKAYCKAAKKLYGGFARVA